MRREAHRAGLAALAFVCAAAGLGAEAPSRSLLPIPRGVETATPSAAARFAEIPVEVSRFAPPASLLPERRDGALDRTPTSGGIAASTMSLAAAVPVPGTTRPAALARAASVAAPALSLRPPIRPDAAVRETLAAAARLTPGRGTRPGARGALCGLPGLEGERLAPFNGRSAGCGIAEPVRLREVDGIPLTAPATITCDTARALQTWVRQGLVPAVGRTGGGVRNLRVVASYACRTRNSQNGARLSEHARGNAIDIAGIGLADGSELTLLDDWGRGREGRILRQLHQSACGPFGTVLGPDSDRFHRDHFHFDVAAYRSGAYCR